MEEIKVISKEGKQNYINTQKVPFLMKLLTNQKSRKTFFNKKR